MSTSDIVYAAHTATCTFLLDGEGMCRRVLTRTKAVKESKIAKRCLGAQYVASLDMTSEAGLVEMPVVGAFLLFARIDDGRVALVRTAPLDRFEEVVVDARPRTTDRIQRGFKTERMAHPPTFEADDDDAPDARTNQVRAVKDPDPILAQRYHDLLDRAAHAAADREGQPITWTPATPARPGGVLPKRLK